MDHLSASVARMERSAIRESRDANPGLRCAPSGLQPGEDDCACNATALWQTRLINRRPTRTRKEAPMLTLHHLNDSRSQRILWLLEELGLPYEMKRYQRNPEPRLAPPELKAVHPLGKSPVIIDGDIKIAESGAIVDYIIRHYGQGNGKPALMPAVGSADYEAYHEW